MKIKKNNLLVVIAFIAMLGSANMPAISASRGYDVLSYNLKFDLTTMLDSTSQEPNKRQFQAQAAITLMALANGLDRVELDANKLNIQSVLLNGQVYIYFEVVDSILKVTLDNPIDSADIITLTIDYIYNNPINQGLVYGKTQTSAASHLSVFTNNEPKYAQYWFPCNDVPDDKAASAISIEVPYSYTAVSNGMLDSIRYNVHHTGDEADTVAATFYWSDTSQVATYLMFFAASDFVKYSEWAVIENSTPKDSIPLEYYMWQEDYNGTTHNAKAAFKNTADMMNIFSSLFGRYPFGKYGIAVVDYLLDGHEGMGMENQTITAVDRQWIESPNYYIGGLAHELAHHWFGNSVTCETWSDIWFNEGGASWSQAVYAENMNGTKDEKRYYDEMFWQGYRYLYYAPNYAKNVSIYSTYEVVGDDMFFTNYARNIYEKASWVYHQLSEIIGKDLMYSILRELLDEYRYKNISTEEFTNYFITRVDNPSVDLDTYFTQWLYQAGYPKYEITSESKMQEDGKTKITVNLAQIQTGNNIPEAFVMPLEFILSNSDTAFTFTAVNNAREQQFEFHLDTLVTINSIAINTDKVLCTFTNNHSGIDEALAGELLVYPTPAGTHENIFVKYPDHCIENIELFDIFGKRIDTGMDIDSETATINISSLANGIYFIKVNNSIIEKIAIDR